MKSLVLLMVLSTATLACSGKTDALQKDLDSLRNEVSRLRSANLAMQDRLDAIEVAKAAAPSAEEESSDDPSDRPVLEVVRLSPETPPEVAPPVTPDEDIDASRPVIQGEGDQIARYADEKEARQAAAEAEKARKRELALRRWRKSRKP